MDGTVMGVDPSWNKGLNEDRTHFRPQMSAPTPQKAAPTSSPTFCPSLMNGGLKLNSLTVGGRIRPVTIYVHPNQEVRMTWGCGDSGIITTHGPQVISVRLDEWGLILVTRRRDVREPPKTSHDEETPAE